MAIDTNCLANDEPSSKEYADTSQHNIAESARIISTLTTTAETSRRILRQVRLSFETQKMLESSKQMSKYCKHQIRRAKRCD